MRKCVSCLLLCLLLLTASAVPVRAEEAGTESLAAVEVYVDDTLVTNAFAQEADGIVYASVFFVSAALRPDMAAYTSDGAILIKTEDLEFSAYRGSSYVIANGRYLYLPSGVREEETFKELLVPIEILAKVFGSPVERNEGAYYLHSGGEVIVSGEEFYNAETVDLLGRVIRNESGNQPLAGQIAVGNVLLNRVSSPIFPDNLYDVVHQPGQFPGTTREPPDEDSLIAAKLCLEGAVTVKDAYWFCAVGRACWASRNKTLVATIGNHAFYG